MGIIVVEIFPSSSQACTLVIDELPTVPLMVNGSPRNTFRVDLSVGVKAGGFPVVTGTTVLGPGVDAVIAVVAVCTIRADVVHVNEDAGCDRGNNEDGLKTPAGILERFETDLSLDTIIPHNKTRPIIIINPMMKSHFLPGRRIGK